jgi:ABC-2 type transport system ATP-binding protein
MTNAIEIRGLVKNYPAFTLGPLDLTVPHGAIYGLIGPNGAGKTTAIDLIFGMGRNNAGAIRVLGLDHRADEVALKRRAAYVSPDLNFAVWGKVGKTIRFVRGFYPDWDDAYCAELMKAFHLSDTDKIATLSFGAKTKLSLLLALSRRPEVLILDEPTTGLDAVSKQQVFGELLKAVENGERTVLISSHGLSDIERFADHIGMIKNGRLLLEGRTDEIVDRYRLAEFFTSNGAQFQNRDGLVILKRSENR